MWKIAKTAQQESEVYLQVYTKVRKEIITDLERRGIRMHFLQVWDWAYARKTHGNLMGLSFILPEHVIADSAPIDVVKYFTDEELEAIREGLELFSKDMRTTEGCKQFILRD